MRARTAHGAWLRTLSVCEGLTRTAPDPILPHHSAHEAAVPQEGTAVSRLIRRPIILVGAAVLLTLTTAGLVYGLTVGVNGDGYMYACYLTTNGDVRLRNKGAGCPRGYAQTKWYGAAPPAAPKTTVYAADQEGEDIVPNHPGAYVQPPAGGTYLLNASIELENREGDWVTAACHLTDSPGNYYDTVEVDLAPAGEGGSERFVTLQGTATNLPRYGVWLECYDPADWLIGEIDVLGRHGHISAIRADAVVTGP